MKYLLTICIPTKDRVLYLKSLLDYLATNLPEKVEILIQDNSETDVKVDEMLPSGHEGIRYYRNETVVTVEENFERAVQNAQGKYVCLIGDDDCVSKKILDIVDWMEEGGIETVSFTNAKYFWPDLRFSKFRGALAGWLGFKYRFDKPEAVNPGKLYGDFLKSGLLNYYSLPKLYHGIASKECLDRLRSKSGSYFPGPSPDMSNAVGLVHITRKHVHVFAPYFISGKGGQSMSAKGVSGTHHGGFEDASFLTPEIKASWSLLVPRYWSGNTIWAQSAITAAHSLGVSIDSKYLRKTYASCLIFDKAYKSEIETCYFANTKSKNKTLSQLWIHFPAIYLARVRSFLNNIRVAVLVKICPRKYKFSSCVGAMEMLDVRLEGYGDKYL